MSYFGKRESCTRKKTQQNSLLILTHPMVSTMAPCIAYGVLLIAHVMLTWSRRKTEERLMVLIDVAIIIAYGLLTRSVPAVGAYPEGGRAGRTVSASAHRPPDPQVLRLTYDSLPGSGVARLVDAAVLGACRSAAEQP
jgi:hypothetical protein